ncbi:MAG TPA: hypothetical protein VF981_13160 [Gemmatimonadaceae bacterium]
MSARKDILDGKFRNSPAGSEALRKAGGGTLAEHFASFVGYANATWHYAAQPGGLTATSLLDGDGQQNVACGTLREAFKIILRDDLGIGVANADINEYFLTKPGLQCFDPRVKGNVGNFGRGTFDVACHFSTHYFVQAEGKYLDPCLMSVYSSVNGPIAHRTRPIQGSAGSLRKAGTGLALVILRLQQRQVPGFGSVWEILLPAECKKAVAAKDLQALKNDPDIKAGKLL